MVVWMRKFPLGLYVWIHGSPVGGPVWEVSSVAFLGEVCVQGFERLRPSLVYSLCFVCGTRCEISTFRANIPFLPIRCFQDCLPEEALPTVRWPSSSTKKKYPAGLLTGHLMEALSHLRFPFSDMFKLVSGWQNPINTAIENNSSWHLVALNKCEEGKRFYFLAVDKLLYHSF